MKENKITLEDFGLPEFADNYISKYIDSGITQYFTTTYITNSSFTTSSNNVYYIPYYTYYSGNTI